MKYYGFVMTAAAVVLLSACSGVSQRSPVPVEDRSVGDASGEPAGAAPASEEGRQAERAQPGAPAAAAVSDSPVVVAMLEDADSKRRAGRTDAAASSLERALAMEPKNAYLWHRLAALRLEQGNWQQAYVLANKSNSLVRDKPSLQIANWRIIAQAKRRQGDARAAAEAERAIRRLESEE